MLLVKEDELLLMPLLEVEVALVVDNELVFTWLEEVGLLAWVKLELSILLCDALTSLFLE